MNNNVDFYTSERYAEMCETLKQSRHKQFASEFGQLNVRQTELLIKEVVKSQTTGVIKGMSELDVDIQLPRLGMFRIHPLIQLEIAINLKNPTWTRKECLALAKTQYQPYAKDDE